MFDFSENKSNTRSTTDGEYQYLGRVNGNLCMLNCEF
jgi:hypothetical protein